MWKSFLKVKKDYLALVKNAEVELTPVATMVSEEAVEEVVEPVVETVEEITVETVERGSS